MFSGEIHTVHICVMKEIFGRMALAKDVQEDISTFLSVITGSIIEKDRVAIFKSGEEIDYNRDVISEKSILDVFVRD